MVSWIWRVAQVGVVALFLYGDWETNFSEGKPGLTLIAGIIAALALTVIGTAAIDGWKSLALKFRRRAYKGLSKGALSSV